MDEPLSNLDAKLRVGMRAEIIKLHRSLGVTTFYVTHDQTEAMTMGQRVVVMRDGVVQQIGAPNVLYQRPANRFVAGFIGTPSMNFLQARLENGRAVGQGFSLALDDLGIQAARSRPDVCIGIRPEHLHLARGENGGGRLTGLVEVVEPLGAVTLIQVRVDATTLTAQIAPGRQVSMGDTVTLFCEPEMLYLFDADADVLLKGISLDDDA